MKSSNNQLSSDYIKSFLNTHNELTEIPKKDLKKLLVLYFKKIVNNRFQYVIYNITGNSNIPHMIYSSNKLSELIKLLNPDIIFRYVKFNNLDDWNIIQSIIQLFSGFSDSVNRANNIFFINTRVVLKYLDLIDYNLEDIKFCNKYINGNSILLPFKISHNSKENFSVCSTMIKECYILLLIKNAYRLFISKVLLSDNNKLIKLVIPITNNFYKDINSNSVSILLKNVLPSTIKISPNLKDIIFKKVRNTTIFLDVCKDIHPLKTIKELEKYNNSSQLWLYLLIKNKKMINLKYVYVSKNKLFDLYSFRLFVKICKFI